MIDFLQINPDEISQEFAFAKAYNNVYFHFKKERIIEGCTVFNLIDDYLSDRIEIKDVPLIMANGVTLFEILPSPRQIVESIEGTPLKRALAEWARIVEGWNKMNVVNYRGSVAEFANKTQISLISEKVLVILGMENTNAWSGLHGKREEFLIYYQAIL